MSEHEPPRVVSISTVLQRRRQFTAEFPIPPPGVTTFGVFDYLDGVEDGRKLKRITAWLVFGLGTLVGLAVGLLARIPP